MELRAVLASWVFLEGPHFRPVIFFISVPINAALEGLHQ